MIHLIKKIWKSEGQENLITPPDAKGAFNLYYKDIIIGTLQYEKSKWTFEYSKEYKENPKIEPIIDFPDINKFYENEELWPFFSARIPTINQPYQFKKINNANIDKNDEVALLKVFGKFTITNPYRLSPL